MESSEPISVVRYNRKMQGRKTFDCGVESLDNFIANLATQQESRDISRVFVVLDSNSSNIIGYYSLNATSFQLDSLPEPYSKNIRVFDVPAVLLGRLAVDKNHQNKGLGVHLMMNAFERVYKVNDDMATQSMIIDAIDESAALF